MRIIELKRDHLFEDSILRGITRKDKPRRYEIHFTDLLYSPIVSFYRKLFPATFEDMTYENYLGIQHWLRGIGHELGSVRVMRGANLVYQKLTRLGFAIGSIDVILNGIIYELTTTRFLAKREIMRNPFEAKLEQLLWYMASENARVGIIKIFDVVHPRNSRTWKAKLTQADVKRYRVKVESLSIEFNHTMLTGEWRNLPRTTHKWRIKEEANVVEWLEEHPKTLEHAHYRWLIAKEEYKLKKYLEVLERRERSRNALGSGN